MRNLTLAQYCPTDSALTKEQERIEEQLQTFERNIWSVPVKEEAVDTTSVISDKDEKKEKKSSRLVRRTNVEEEEKKVEKKKTTPSTSTAPVMSVRRQRR